MESTKKFRLIIWCLILTNILNFFFLAISYSGEYVKEGMTFFDVAMNLNLQIETRFGFKPEFLSSNSPFLFIPILIVNIVLIIILVKSSKNCFLKLNEPVKPLMIVSCIGIILHFLYFNFSIPNQEKTYMTLISKGMIGNFLFIISYALIIGFSVLFIKNEEKELKISKLGIISIFILVELIISFFFFSIVNNARVWVSGYEEYGKKDHWAYYNRLFFSPFEMTYKHNNYYNLEGKIETYSYMWIVFIIYMVSIIVTFIKAKWAKIVNAILAFISIIFMFICAIDMVDSYMMNYVCIGEKTFFSCVGLAFYVIIILNIALCSIKIYQFIFYDRKCFILTNNNVDRKNSYISEENFEMAEEKTNEDEVIRRLIEEGNKEFIDKQKKK